MSIIERDPIIADLEAFIGRYAVLPKEEKLITAVWLAGTHLFSPKCANPHVFPFLFINSAQSGSGKTQLGVDVIGNLARNAFPTVGITGAALFRLAASKAQPTLILDEVDTMSRDGNFRALLNVGYKMGGAVPRATTGGRSNSDDDEDDSGVDMFNVYGAKVLIGIDNGSLDDTTRSRCLSINLKRATPAELDTIEDFYPYEVEDELMALMLRLNAWAFDHSLEIREYRPEKVAELVAVSPRTWEVCRPIVAIAHAAGCEDEVIQALIKITANKTDSDAPAVALLKLIKKAFEELDTDRLTVAFILEYIGEDDRFKGWNGVKLAAVLRPYEAFPHTVRFNAAQAHKISPNLRPTGHKGYERNDFADAFARYAN